MTDEFNSKPQSGENIAGRLNHLLEKAGLAVLDQEVALQFERYLAILTRWNSRVNLTAVRDEEGILQRHFVESIACAQALPQGIRSVLDFGSGGGFPGIPIALCRPEIAVTLSESQNKKAAFLQEALRALDLRATVYAGRAETLSISFHCVTMRAVDRMKSAVAAAARLVGPGGRLVVMTTEAELPFVQKTAGEAFQWGELIPLPGGSERLIAVGLRHPLE